MEECNESAVSSCNKKLKSVDFKLCLICQVKTKITYYTIFVFPPTLSSMEKLITITDARCLYGETKFSALKRRIRGLSANELMENGIPYHNKCYKDLTNKTSIERAELRYKNILETGSSCDVKQKKQGRPVKFNADSCTSTSQRSTRNETFDNALYIFCQEDIKGEKLHEVSTANMGAQLKEIGEQTSNERLKVILNNVVSSSDLLTAVAEGHEVSPTMLKSD